MRWMQWEIVRRKEAERSSEVEEVKIRTSGSSDTCFQRHTIKHVIKEESSQEWNADGLFSK